MVNQQARLRLRTPAIRRLASWLWAQTAAARPIEEVRLVFTDDDGIAPVNAAVFGKPRPTDVITVPYDPLPGRTAPARAEIFVNAQRALAVGRRGPGVERELALYIAHGLQHLSGASDRTPTLRARMRKRELAWLREAGRLGLLRLVIGP